MSKNLNHQLIFQILIIINVILTGFLIWSIFKTDSRLNYLTEKSTHADLVLRTRIECVKNPSETCEKEIQRTEKNLQDLINRYGK